MRILLPFFDDSTLIFAARLKRMLIRPGVRAETAFQRDSRDRSDISDRQMALSLPEGPDHVIDQRFWTPGGEVMDYDATASCRALGEINALISYPLFRLRQTRPCFVAFGPGLELTPERGLRNRRHHDVIFANSAAHRDLYLRKVGGRGWQYVSYGHPYFLQPPSIPADDPKGTIYFFTQSISPATYEGRAHVMRVMITLAKAYPDRKVRIKLRHLPGENLSHVNREKFPYPDIAQDLAATMGPLPSNLEFTAGSMDEALAEAGICITCTSTAAMDAISAGRPTALYLDYVEHHADRLVAPTRKEFAHSGLITPLEDLLHLRLRSPEPAWMEGRFRPPNFLNEMLEAIAKFRQRSLAERLGLIPPGPAASTPDPATSVPEPRSI